MLLPPASNSSSPIADPSSAQDIAKTTEDTVCMPVHLPVPLWQAVQLLAAKEGNANAVILRALEQYFAAAQTQPDQPGEYHTLMSRPIADLHLSPRAANAFGRLNLRYLYELAAVPQRKTNALKGVGQASTHSGPKTPARCNNSPSSGATDPRAAVASSIPL